MSGDGNTSRLAVDFCGLRLNTPLVLLSGCVGFGEEYTRVEGFSNRQVGAVCLKGTTLSARLGNQPHRVWETPGGMLNSIGLQNPGSRHAVENILPELDFEETRFFANVCGATLEEYVQVTRIFDDSPIDAIEINISCPNIKRGGVEFGNDPEMSARVVEACRAQTNKPIITKLSPNQTDIRENARKCIEAGTDAFAVINTVMGMAIDVEENLYLTRESSIEVYSSSGVKLAEIPLPAPARNVTFGRDQAEHTLYITAGGSLYRIEVKKKGYRATRH